MPKNVKGTADFTLDGNDFHVEVDRDADAKTLNCKIDGKTDKGELHASLQTTGDILFTVEGAEGDEKSKTRSDALNRFAAMLIGFGQSFLAQAQNPAASSSQASAEPAQDVKAASATPGSSGVPAADTGN